MKYFFDTETKESIKREMFKKNITHLILFCRRLEKEEKGKGLKELRDIAFEHMNSETYNQVYKCIEDPEIHFIFEDDITQQAKKACEIFGFNK